MRAVRLYPGPGLSGLRFSFGVVVTVAVCSPLGREVASCSAFLCRACARAVGWGVLEAAEGECEAI